MKKTLIVSYTPRFGSNTKTALGLFPGRGSGKNSNYLCRPFRKDA